MGFRRSASLSVFAAGLWLAGAGSAHARVFDYKEASVAPFVRGTGAFSLLAQDAFANGAPTGVAMTGASKFAYGAEIGVALGSARTHLRLGAEILQPAGVTADGSNASGTSLYSVSSSVFVFNPNLVIEQVYSVRGILRYYLAVGVGYANVSVTNDYKMTAAGTSALSVADFKESMTAASLSGTAAVGLETLFTDNVTFMGEFGYRYMPVRGLKYSNDGTGFHGAFAKGDPVTNSDGSARELNLGGLFGGVAFRFYLNFL